MSVIGMDPLLRRGIRLMLSKAPDALDQLKALAEEAIVAKQRNVTGKMVNEDVGLSLIPPKRARLADHSTSLAASVITPHTPSPTPSIKSDGGSSKAGSRRSDESDQEADMNDIAQEITHGISCTVCKRIAFYSMNQLVECQECHLIYHQDCHKPCISKADITDPRRVWYCAKCTRNIRKQTSGGSGGGSSSSGSGGGVGSSTRSSSSANKSSSSSSSSSSNSSRHVSQSPSKTFPSSSSSGSHSTQSPSKSSTSSSSRDSGGSSSLSSSSGGSGSSSRLTPFANLSAVSTRATIGGERSIITRDSTKASSSSSTNNSSSSSLGSRGDSKGGSSSTSTSAPSNSMLSAERRMQMMKKKAAAKIAERRKM